MTKRDISFDLATRFKDAARPDMFDLNFGSTAGRSEQLTPSLLEVLQEGSLLPPRHRLAHRSVLLSAAALGLSTAGLQRLHRRKHDASVRVGEAEVSLAAGAACCVHGEPGKGSTYCLR